MHCVVKEDQVHFVGRRVIIVLKLTLQLLNQLTAIDDLFINAASVNLENIAELDSVFAKDLILLDTTFEVTAKHFHDLIGEPLSVVVIGEAIHEDTRDFVDPKFSASVWLVD